jgi:hypothetical protein
MKTENKAFWIFISALAICFFAILSIPIANAYKEHNKPQLIQACIEEEIAKYEEENNVCLVDIGSIPESCEAKYN